MPKPLFIYWFRQDLRLRDNPALIKAAQQGDVLAIFILDEQNAKEHAPGGASRWWLHHSLTALNKDLGGMLNIYQGDGLTVLQELIQRLPIGGVYWNRCYEPWRIARDRTIKAQLKQQGITVASDNSALLWEPWQIKTQQGTPYKVFTPFYRKGCLQAPAPRQILPAPQASYKKDSGCLTIEDLALLPTVGWHKSLEPHWQISEQAAHEQLQQFIEQNLSHYKEGRDFPAKPYVSRLSPYLHWGQLSPHQLWHSLRSRGDDHHIEHFCSELGWREFSYSQLVHYPELPYKNWQTTFDHFPWQDNPAHLQAWQQGKTGIPMVDAGMRELWQTGYMHNRLRLIVGSFLVKNLRLHWRHGERWFWDTLVDADLANNSANWQWIAGCGADAAPYFRIFNPVTQGSKFDPDGDYIRRFVPELTKLPTRYLYSPWQAPNGELTKANIQLGVNYPRPIVDLAESRQQALAAFKSLKIQQNADK